MTREEAISHIEYSIKAYQNLIENDARSGEAIGKDIKGEWKSEKTLADAYMKMIESLKMAIKALEESKTVSIPEGATNGDVFTIMFNKTFPKTIVMYENDESRLTINPIFSREWWETPYKAETEVEDGND